MNLLRARFNLPTFIVFFIFLTIFVSISATDLFSVSVTASDPRDEVRAASLSLPLDQANQARVTTVYGKLPMSFEVNRGQTDAQVKFLTRGDGYSLFLTSSEAVLSLSKPVTGTKATASPAAKDKGPELKRRHVRQDVVRIRLVGANPAPNMYGVEELPGKSNYLIGNDPRQWHTDVAHYAKVKYEAVYRGVDVVYYGNQRQLEYDFIVAPGADPSVIKLAFKGTRSIEIDADGDLVLQTRSGEVRQRKPFIYQEINGERREVAGHYVKHGQKQVRFKVSPYDQSRPLVIDPVLVYSTYLGGSGNDLIYAVAGDGVGNAYVAGYTASPNFPATAGAFQSVYDNGEVAFVTKLDAAGSALVYSTFLGGSGSLDQAYGIAVDNIGHAYVVGTTNSQNFPTTAGAFDTAADVATDVFVTKLSASGSSLIYSTCLGGGAEDRAHAVAIDEMGHAYVTGYTRSSNFPITPGAFDTSYNGSRDIFVTKLDVSGFALVYSTYIGGSGIEQGNDIALDESGNAYLTGETSSPGFPTTIGAFDRSLSGGSGNSDAFVTKLNSAGSTLTYSTILGGSRVEVGNAVAVDTAGHAYVTGYTTSLDFPVASGAFDPFPGGSFDVFVTKLSLTGSTLIYSTHLGSVGVDIGYGIAVDDLGQAYVTGSTDSPDFPTTTDALDASYAGSTDTFVTTLSTTGSALVYSAFLGGGNYEVGHRIVVDPTGSVYVAGITKSTDFPTTPGTFETSYNGGFFDSFITKLSGLAPTPTPTPAPCPNIGIDPLAAPAGTVGAPHSLSFVAMGGLPPYSFSASGNLPPSLSLSSNGQLAGAPTNIGTFDFILAAIDANNCAGQRSYQLVISCPAITVSPSSLSIGMVNVAYDQFITPEGGTTPYTFTISGTLPPGLSLDAAGRLSGTPSTSGSFTFTVIATDAFGCGGNVTYTLEINPEPTPAPTPTPTPTPEPCNVGLAANGATATASSQHNQDYPVSSVIDGERNGNNWGMGGGWNDATLGHFPDNLEITFSSAKTINEVDVYTLKNQPNDGSSVNDSTLATVYGIRNFTLQYRTESGFVPLPIGLESGLVSGNTLAKRKFVFSPITTDKIRIIVHDSADHLYSRIVEIEAYTCTPVVPPPPTPTPTPPVSNGKIAFETFRDGNSEIYLMDGDGSNPTRLTNDNSRDADPFFSPDGLRIVFPSRRDGNYEIYVMNVDGSNQTRLTSNTVDDLRPTFSPDGSKIVFYRNTGNSSEIYVMNADGTGEVRLTNNSSADEFPKWSPDGTRIIFQSNRDGDEDIYTMTVDGLDVVKLTNNNSRDWEGSFSPDGSKILFSSDRTGNTEIWVMNADGSQPINLSNSANTDGSCSWSADGRKILFVSGRDGNTEIYMMNADGTGQTRLTINTVMENTPVSQPVR